MVRRGALPAANNIVEAKFILACKHITRGMASRENVVVLARPGEQTDESSSRWLWTWQEGGEGRESGVSFVETPASS